MSRKVLWRRRGLGFALLVGAGCLAAWWTLEEPAAQVVGGGLDTVYFIRYVCVPEVGPAGPNLAAGLLTPGARQIAIYRTSVYVINTTSVPIDGFIRFSGRNGIAGQTAMTTLPAGAAADITCQDIAQAIGQQPTGEGYVFLRAVGGGVTVSVTRSAFMPDLSGAGGGVSFSVEPVAGQRAGALAFF